MKTIDLEVPVKNYESQNKKTIKIVAIIILVLFDAACAWLYVIFGLQDVLEPWKFWSAIGFVILANIGTILSCIFFGRKKKTDVLQFLKPIKEWTNPSFLIFELKKSASTAMVQKAIASTCKNYFFESEDAVKKFCHNHPGIVRVNQTHFFVKENDSAPVSVVLVQLGIKSKHIVTHYLSLSDKELKATEHRRFVIKNEMIKH